MAGQVESLKKALDQPPAYVEFAPDLPPVSHRAPRVIQVIEVYEQRGSGTEEDVYREVRRYYTLEGRYLAENDPVGIKVLKITEVTP